MTHWAHSPWRPVISVVRVTRSVNIIGEGTMNENTALEQVGSGADRLDAFFTP